MRHFQNNVVFETASLKILISTPQRYDTGDGIFFTFAMSVGILLVGLLTGSRDSGFRVQASEQGVAILLNSSLGCEIPGVLE